MAITNKPLRPTDRKIDARVRVLGVLGFLVLLAIFFSIGLFCIGKRLGSSGKEAQPSESMPAYVPPQQRQSPAEEQAGEKGPDIKLEVTEEGQDAAAADQPAQAGDGVKVDENGVTMTLDGESKPPAEKPNDGNVPSAVEPTGPTVPPKSKPGDLEKPRAATEKRATAAPGRE